MTEYKKESDKLTIEQWEDIMNNLIEGKLICSTNRLMKSNNKDSNKK